MDVKKAITTLSALRAPSGFETPAAKGAAELLRPYVDELWVTPLGSLIGVRRCGKPGAKKLLLDAHLDEIGLIVTGIEEGFLHFRSIGGVDPRMLPNREVWVLTDPPTFGVITSTPPHVQAPGEDDKSFPAEELCIDTGLSQAEAEKRIPIGTPIVYNQDCVSLGEKRLAGKAMDDRACFVSLLRCMDILADKPLDVDVYVMGSTLEEISGNGASTAAFSIAPDWCVAVDVTHAETPDVSRPEDRVSKLGEGPVIGIGPNMTSWITKRMRDKAAAGEIPCQLEVMTGHTGTNGWGMQVSREGIATGVVSLPLRYMHTPIEVLDLEDLENLSQLLAAFALDLGKEAETVC